MHGIHRIDSGNPNGVVEALAPAICYTSRLGIWVKINFQFDSLGWSCLVSDGSPGTDPHLLFDSVVSGNGAPSHIPEIDNQYYTQKDSVPPGQVFNWYDSAWIH